MLVTTSSQDLQAGVNPPRAKAIKGTPDITRQIRCDSIAPTIPDPEARKPDLPARVWSGTRVSRTTITRTPETADRGRNIPGAKSDPQATVAALQHTRGAAAEPPDGVDSCAWGLVPAQRVRR